MKISNTLKNSTILSNDQKPIWSEEEKKIIAWSICWEGNISIRLHQKPHTDAKQGFSYSVQMAVSNTNFKLLKKFFEIARIGLLRREGNIYRWKLENLESCQWVLNNILDYLPAKKEQASLALIFANSRLSKRNEKGEIRGDYTAEEIECWYKCRKLNKRPNYKLHGCPPIESYQETSP